MGSRFYVTTPIYYINDVPHLGSAYTTIAADVLARFHRLRGDETRFLTGTDEHGLKIQRVAAERGVPPQTFADEIAAVFRDTWPQLDCAFDDFIRTTEPRHKSTVQELWKTIRDNKNKAEPNIYLGHYEGLYCVACEAYYTEKELEQPGNICPQHRKPVEMVKEESYFFRLSAYADELLAYYESHPDFVQPAGRFNEVKSFVQAGLQDLSISRTTFQWGVPVPDDPRHVMYVWFDALTNYWSALRAPEDEAHLWPSAVHLVGKDILRFHAVYWPAFLLAAGMPLPKHVFAHGFLTYTGQKMSKSLRNTVSPVGLARALSPKIGADVVRYCLMRAISFGHDGDFSIHDVLQRYSSELGNTLGNLLNRVLPFAREAPPRGEAGELEKALTDAYPAAAQAVTEAFDQLNPTAALTALWGLLGRANEYIDKAAPWAAKKKGDAARLGTIVGTLLDLLEGVSVLVAPVMPTVANEMRRQLGLAPFDWKALAKEPQALWPLALPRRAEGVAVVGGDPIFPRFEKEREAEIVQQFAPPPPVEAPAAEAKKAEPEAKKAEVAAPEREAKATITFADFEKIDIRVGLIVSAERVKKKDKLLDLRVDTGDAQPRRIIAGIAAAYAPEALVGKRVAVLCNLAPRDFGKGLVSEGMILAAEDGGGLSVLTPEREKAPGSPVK
ncbi:MAG: methionine--tRNA ligase [Minicystis sp.]